MREFESGATRDTDQGKNDYRGFVSPQALKRFGDYMTEHRVQADGKLRDSDNWKKGIPQKEYLSSLLRHVVDLHWAIESNIPTVTDKVVQDLLSAIWFNTQGLLHERVLGRDVGREVPKVDHSAPESLSAEYAHRALDGDPNGLSCGFVWSNSPQGHEFWKREHDTRLQKGLSLSEEAASILRSWLPKVEAPLTFNEWLESKGGAYLSHVGVCGNYPKPDYCTHYPEYSRKVLGVPR